jgi:hypothetical protein
MYQIIEKSLVRALPILNAMMDLLYDLFSVFHTSI